MKRIIIHWSAGTYKPNSVELEHYHYLIGYEKNETEKAEVHFGKCRPEDNLNCTNGSRYAAHTGGGNTGSIGVALCGMFGFYDIRHIGNYPLKPVQMEVCYELCARLCIKDNIPISKETVMTHYEFGKKNPCTTSRGKQDIAYLATNPSLNAGKIGDFIRNKIKWYYEKLILKLKDNEAVELKISKVSKPKTNPKTKNEIKKLSEVS